MILAVLALIAWFVMIVFAFVRKGMSLNDLIFLYFIIVIITITLFTILDINLHWVPLTRTVEGSFAMYICRFIVIPFHILMSVCAVHLPQLKSIWRWGIPGANLLFLCVEDRIYLMADLITYQSWNELYSFLMYSVFIVLIWWIARWFVGLDRGGFK
ncbi:hypothetical protein D3C76_201690 [compost metagenome]